ncbi:MAG: DUF2167 domain-containing protein [Gammaproteobacteria bacterium]
MRTSLRLLLVSLTLLTALHANAQQSAPSSNAQPDVAAQAQTEMEAAFTAAQAAMQVGPAEIKFLDQTTFKLPAGFVFVPTAESKRLLLSMGNAPGDDLLGTVFPQDEKANWFVVARFENSGYIKDDDAKDWNADELLEGLKQGTEEANQERVARGIPPMEVIGWVEAPHYEAATHRLVWSASTQDKNAPADAEKGINYNTYALGREGYISMNLVSDLSSIEAQKPIARQLLGALDYNEGKRYSDFNASTDTVAAYGLAALVAGVGAKKLGLLAVIGAFVAKFFKVIVLTAIGAAAGIGKLLKGRHA